MKVEGFSRSALSDLRSAIERSQPEVTVNIAVPPTQVIVDLDQVAVAINQLQSSLAGRLDHLVRTMANPTATAGEELLRRGALAWQHAWWDDARRDLNASIKAYPYRGGPYFFLGLTELALGRPTEALGAFKLSVKYGAAGDAECSAAAALIAERMLLAVGANRQALDVLTDAARELPPCLPVLSGLAALSGVPDDRERLLAALISTDRADEAALRLARTEAEQLRNELFGDVTTVCETLIQIGDLFDSLAESNVARQLLDELREPIGRCADTALEWLELHDQRRLPTDAVAWCRDVARRFLTTDWTTVLARLHGFEGSFKEVQRDNSGWLERNTGMSRDPQYRGGGAAKRAFRAEQYDRELARLLFHDTETEVAAIPVKAVATIVTRLSRTAGSGLDRGDRTCRGDGGIRRCSVRLTIN